MPAYGDGKRTGHPSLLHKNEAELTRMGGSRELILETIIGYNAQIEWKGEWRKKETNKPEEVESALHFAGGIHSRRLSGTPLEVPATCTLSPNTSLLLLPPLLLPTRALPPNTLGCHALPFHHTQHFRHKSTRNPFLFLFLFLTFFSLHFEVTDRLQPCVSPTILQSNHKLKHIAHSSSVVRKIGEAILPGEHGGARGLAAALQQERWDVCKWDRNRSDVRKREKFEGLT